MIPGSDEWNRLVTASKVAAILGVSPWESPRSVWHRMRGDLPREEQTTAQSRGHYLEPAILAWWRDQHPEYRHVDSQHEYLLDDWAAATPDALAIWGGSRVDAPEGRERVLIEAKSTNSLDDWGDPGTDAIPDYYLVQVHWQLHVSGLSRCYVPVIGPRLQFAEYVVDAMPKYGALLEKRMREFYDSLSADEPPPLDDSLATFNAVRRVHPDIEAGAEVEIPEGHARELLSAVLDLDDAEARTRLAKSVALEAIGRAQYLTCNGVRIARRQPNKSGVSFVALPKNLPLLTEQELAS